MKHILVQRPSFLVALFLLFIVTLGERLAACASADDPQTMRIVFSDDFATDTRKDYFTGFGGSAIRWKAGKLTIGSGGIMTRKIEAGAVVAIEAEFSLPELRKDGEASETDMIFMVQGGKRSVASLRRAQVKGKIVAEARIMVWPSTNLLPEMVENFPLDADIPAGTLTALYRSGTVELVHDGKVVASGKIENGERPVSGVTLSHYGADATCQKLVVWTPASAEVKTPKGLNLGDAIALTLAVIRGRSLYEAGKWQEAAAEYEKAVELSKRVNGPEHASTLAFTDSWATVLSNAGEDDRVERMYLQVLAARRRTLGKKHTDCTFTLNNLANLYLMRGDYSQAEPLLLESKEILDQTPHGSDQAMYGVCLYNLGALYYRMGRYEQAEPILRRASQLIKKNMGGKHPDYAVSLNSLAELYRAMGDVGRAEPLFREALGIFKQSTSGEKHPYYILTLYNLSEMYRGAGDYKAALPFAQEAVAAFEDTVGRKHVFYASAANGLACAYHRLGDDRAEQWYRRALENLKASMGENHFRYALSLSNLAELYVEQHRWTEAAELISQSRHILRRHIAGVLPGFTEPEQAAFLQTDEGYSFHMALSLGLLHRDDPAIAEQSASWVSNGKGLIYECMAGRADLAISTDDQVTKIRRELLATRAQLSRLTRQETVIEERTEKLIARLNEREEKLSKEVGRLGGVERNDPWVDITEIRKQMPDESVMIEIVRLNIRQFGANTNEKMWGPPRYAAWIIPETGKGEVRAIDLGDADRIESAVRAVRQAFHEAPAAIDAMGRDAAGKELRQPLKALADLVLRPLEAHIGGTPNWLLSPDADLWLVPWAALPLTDGSYAVEKHRISYLISGRELVTSKPKTEKKGLVIMANPDFNMGQDETKMELQQVLGKNAAETQLSLRSGVVLGPWPSLPGTGREAKAVTPRLATYGKATPDVYTDQRALEGVFKTLQRPRVLVLSTHGFFLEDQDYANALVPPGGRGVSIAPSRLLNSPGKPPSNRKPLPFENPLLRCGLVFAGANSLKPADSAIDDGLLTGLEIVGTDLRGTDLVVLSACETGLGQVQNSEGVAGLRQAFQLAGARTVVATLWKIPDSETAELMTAYFENLSAGWSKADALRRAQLALIKSQEELHGDAHPLFWAGFTLTGDPGVGRKDEPRDANLLQSPAPARAKPNMAVQSPTPWFVWSAIVSIGCVLAIGGCCLLGLKLRRARIVKVAAQPRSVVRHEAER